MSKTKNNVEAEKHKLYNSSVYRRQVKRAVESIKKLRGIKYGEKLPGNPDPLSKNATEKERETYAKKNAFRVDRSSAHFWATSIDVSFERRIATNTANDEE